MTYFNDPQVEQLLRGVNPKRVHNLKGLSYMEAYDIRAHLNRVFGFARWSADVISMEQIYERFHKNSKGNDAVSVGYRAGLTLTVCAPDGELLATYTEYAAGSASGFPVAKHADAHDMAIKGLALDTKLPTPTGWSTMKDVQVGDRVIDMAGSPVKVVAKSNVKNLRCYRITFGDGHSIICDEEHIWWAKIAQENLRPRSISDIHTAKHLGKPVTVPIAQALELPQADLPVEPYLLGYWLGDGDRNSGRITVGEADLEGTLRNLRDAGADVGSVIKDARDGGAYAVRIGPSSPGSRSGLTRALRDAGYLGAKAIPPEYLRASRDQRLALLQGLMDSDGTCDYRRSIFTSASESLARQVAELVRSLGDRVAFSAGARSGFGRTITGYSVSWTPSLPPFRLDRKMSKMRLRMKAGAHRVVSVEEVETVPTQCISVDSPTRSYLAGESMVPTHNTAESQALKRAAINLGDQFGLSLYQNGSRNPLVQKVLNLEPGEKQDVTEGVPEVVPESDQPDVNPDWITLIQEAGTKEEAMPLWYAARDAGVPQEVLDEMAQIGQEKAA